MAEAILIIGALNKGSDFRGSYIRRARQTWLRYSSKLGLLPKSANQLLADNIPDLYIAKVTNQVLGSHNIAYFKFHHTCRQS